MDCPGHENSTGPVGLTARAMKALNPGDHQEMLLMVLTIHDLLPWRDEDRGMTLKQIRASMAALGHHLTDRQVRYCLAQGAETLWMDVDSREGKRQLWKRHHRGRLCEGLNDGVLEKQLQP